MEFRLLVPFSSASSGKFVPPNARTHEVFALGFALGDTPARSRAVAALIAVGKIEHRGSKKAGGYYANAKASK